LWRGERLLGGTDRRDLGAILREDVGYDLSHVARVVHDQDSDAIEARAIIEPYCGTRYVSPPDVPLEIGTLPPPTREVWSILLTRRERPRSAIVISARAALTTPFRVGASN